MKCQSCGSDNPDNTKFCASCGSKLIPQESAFQDITPPPPPIIPSFNDSAFSQSSDSPFREIPPNQNSFLNQASPQNPYNQNTYGQQGANYQQTPPPGGPYSQYNPMGDNTSFRIAAANKTATTSMVLGIISLFCFGFILGIIALVNGLKARSELVALQQPTGTAIAGIVLGIIGLVGWAISIILIMPYL